MGGQGEKEKKTTTANRECFQFGFETFFFWKSWSLSGLREGHAKPEGLGDVTGYRGFPR